MDNDIIEIKLYDETHTILFKGEYKIKDKKDFERLNHDLDYKSSLKILKSNKKKVSGWFD